MNKLIDKLAGELMILRLPDGPHVTKLTREEALKNARQIARELFPPMAKPLVWRIDGDDICSQHVDFEWYRIRNFPSCAPIDGLLINCALCGITSANSLQWCMTIDEAKAWCESRHQARFLEQLA